MEFLGIDEDLIEVAARMSPTSSAVQDDSPEIEAWIRGLAESEKNVLLLRVIEGQAHVGTELMHRYLGEKRSRELAESSAGEGTRRKVGELLSAARALAEEEK